MEVKCTGLRCPMQNGTIDPTTCQAADYGCRFVTSPGDRIFADRAEMADFFWRCGYLAAKKEIVYCKDCEYLIVSGMYGECSNPHGLCKLINSDDFCSRGERKDSK